MMETDHKIQQGSKMLMQPFLDSSDDGRDSHLFKHILSTMNHNLISLAQGFWEKGWPQKSQYIAQCLRQLGWLLIAFRGME